MTGGQMAPTTLVGMKTSTSPYGRDVHLHGYPLKMADIAAQLEGTAYVTRQSVQSVPAIRKAKKWLPSSLVKHCVVYSEGEFLDESLSTNKEKAEEVFGDMLEHLTQEASRSCVLIEFRNLNNSMFGYRVFRTNDYFPVNWLRYAIRCTVWKRQKTGSVRRVCVR